MRKFRRAALRPPAGRPPRHLDKLVTCPECGQSTHPLACEILSATGVAIPSSGEAVNRLVRAEPRPLRRKPTPRRPRVCCNCAQPIGKLQKLNLWQNSVVCAACYRRLSKEEPEAGVTTVTSRVGASRQKADIAGGDETARPPPQIRASAGMSTLVGRGRSSPA